MPFSHNRKDKNIRHIHFDVFHLLTDPVLQRNAGKSLNAKQAHSYVQALDQMCKFMIVEGEPSKDRQKLLRNLRVRFHRS